MTARARHVPRWYAAWAALALVASLSALALKACSVLVVSREATALERNCAALRLALESDRCDR